MRVPLEPQANLAVAAQHHRRAPSAEAGGSGGSDEGVRHKPILQARRNQYEDYRNMKDRDFQSIHEEVSHLRQSTRDQERIIAILKEEKSRLLAELLQKGKDLQHLKDVMKRPTHSAEERNVLEELKRTLADRECSVDELKSEVVRLNNVHQRALEDYDDVLTQVKQMEQQVYNAQQEAAHRAADAERLKRDIELLNEEMTARVNNINHVVNVAAEVGKRDASTDHHLLEEQLETWKQKYDDLQTQLKRAQDEEQRQKELALRQQAAANEVASEKSELLAEVRRQQTLLGEMDELKAQIDAFRIDKATTEELLREKLHVALVDIHEEKEISRRLMAEVDAKEDIIAGKDREVAKVQREFEARLDEALAGHKATHREVEEKLTKALTDAQRENVQNAEEAARLTLRHEALLKKLRDAEVEHSNTVTERDGHKSAAQSQMSQIQELQATLREAQSALEEAFHEVEALRAQLSQQHAPSSSPVRTSPTAAHHLEQYEILRQSTDLQHRQEVTALQSTHQAALEALASEAARQNEALLVEIAALREAQSEHDLIRHETLANEVDQLMHALETATTALEAERAEKVTLSEQLASMTAQVQAVNAQQDQAANMAALQSHTVALERQVSELETHLHTAVDALEAARKEIEALHVASQVASDEHTKALENAAAGAADAATASASANADKRVERLEKEKKQLQDKLKAAEVDRDDKQKSLDIRGQQLRQEADATRIAQEGMRNAQTALAQEKLDRAHDAAEHEKALATFMAAHEDDINDLHGELEAAKATIVTLTADNEKMKNIQMHW